MSLLLLVLAEFALVVREDPISGDEQAFYGTVDDGNTLAVVCEPGEGWIDIRVVPDRYYGTSSIVGFWSPRADSRFSSQEKPDKDSWSFSDSYLSYNRPNGGQIGTLSHKARFLHRLATDNRLALRFEARQGDVQTIIINYEINADELGSFVGRCGPERVIRYLKEWNSPAAPPE